MFCERRQNGVPRSIDSSTWTSLGNLSGAQWTAGGRTTCVVSIVSVDLLKKLCGRKAAWGPHHCTKTQQQWTWQRGTWTWTKSTAKNGVGRSAIRAINRCDSQTILQPSDGAFGRLQQQPCRQTWNDCGIDIDDGRCLGLERSIRIIVTASITDKEAGVIREQGKRGNKGSSCLLPSLRGVLQYWVELTSRHQLWLTCS